MEREEQLWQVRPVWKLYMFFKQKQKFELSEDCYTDWAMFLVESGRFRYRIGDAPWHEITQKEIVICPPGPVFRREMILPSTFHMIRFALSDVDPDRVPHGKLSIGEDGRFSSDLSWLRRLFLVDTPAAAVLREHIFLDIWRWLLLEEHGLAGMDAAPADDPLVEEAVTYIQAHLRESIRIQDLAARAGLSDVTFLRRFYKSLGETPGRYVMRKRLEKAKRLLTQSSLKIHQIASVCGFESPYYFSNQFKKETGLTPSAYRQQGVL